MKKNLFDLKPQPVAGSCALRERNCGKSRFRYGDAQYIDLIVACEQGISQILSRQYYGFRGLPWSTQDFTVSGIPTLL